jgi:hypothetical protein
VGVPDDARELLLEQAVERGNQAVVVYVVHRECLFGSG